MGGCWTPFRTSLRADLPAEVMARLVVAVSDGLQKFAAAPSTTKL
ncbi:hypothetical protein QO003_002504 [Arthrobacter silviterrae]|nr:hypothetical protein [Arthrobacter silviterrae]MDQ0278201.1 hypothetical protein [Arthrobacter silviterrae]